MKIRDRVRVRVTCGREDNIHTVANVAVCHSSAQLQSMSAHLHCSSEGHRLVRVYLVVKLLPVEKGRQELLNLGDSGRPSNQHHLVYVRFC